MVTVADAAAALGIDERTVRDKLSKEEWKGVKRLVGMKEKWFMYRGELDRQIERLRILRPQERASTEGVDVFESEGNADNAQTVDAQTIEVQSGNRTSEQISMALDEVLSKLTEQFSKQLYAEKEVIFTLKKELEDKDRQLRLLPDVQKQAEDARKLAELKHVETEALKKQIDLLQASTVPKNQVDELEQQINQLEKEKVEAEQSRQKVEELERTLSENKRTADEELERLRKEKDAQAQAIQEQLQLISSKLEKAQRPWWKTWFTAGGDDKTT
jgi:chromosome segregation ATPase